MGHSYSYSHRFKLIVSDLDGTLLDDNHRVTNEAKRAVELARKRGAAFAVASGRCRKALRAFEAELGLTDAGKYGAAHNGGMVYDAGTREALLDMRLERALSLEIIGRLREMGVNMIVYAADRLIAEDKAESVLSYGAFSGLNLEFMPFADIGENFSKVLAVDDPLKITDASERTKTLMAGRAEVFRSHPTMLEFSPMGANKGAAVEYLCGLLGISADEAIAVGDNENDIPMLKAAGMGVAVANAVSHAKDAAKFVARSTNNQGVLLEIVENFL